MKKILIIVLLTLPTVSYMTRFGVWTTHDFHFFRQYEFNLCFREGSFPCRWAPDAGLGFGEPLFNYYGQFTYWLGQLFIQLGLSITASVKLLFLLSLVLSSLSMYLLARLFWSPTGALVSSLFYVYAPYRAVDAWVRGALPESLAFIYYPLILYSLEKKRYLVFSLLVSALLLTHNLSLFMFAPFLAVWWLVRSRDWKFIPALGLVFPLAAFYLLPVFFESHLVTLSRVTSDYYAYQLHFTTLSQLFLSRFWGYGGSTWGLNDTMSLSVGHLHWLIPIIVLIYSTFKYLTLHPSPESGEGTKGRGTKEIWLFTSLAFIAVFLTHGKSEFLWKIIPGMSYVQFPWRFLSISTLFFSLAAGTVKLPRHLHLCLILVIILFNFSFFRPDIWRSVSDSEQFSGPLWDEQRSSALSDFWPTNAALPTTFAPHLPELVSSGAHKQTYYLNLASPTQIIFSTVYFPGWHLYSQGTKIALSHPSGLITASLPPGSQTYELIFQDTPPRTAGNLLSLLSLALVLLFVLKSKFYAKH